MTSFKRLVELAKQLRAPGGCPWDQKQTFGALAKCLEEEAHEVPEAIAKNDHSNLKEELGDLLFNMVMMMNIAEEEGEFTVEDVLADIEHKIISRHTWVFGDDKANTPEEALALWKKNKQKEK